MENYIIETSTSKIERRLKNFIKEYPAIKSKLKRLQKNPRKELNAHQLHGELEGLWGCHLSKNPDIVAVYFISDKNKRIGILRVGSHDKVY